MSFQKGNQLSKGQKRGTGKFTNLKEDFLKAFKQLGGWKGLVEWAKKSSANKRVFYQMISRMLPTNLTFGADGSNKIEIVISKDFKPKKIKRKTEEPTQHDVIDVPPENVVEITNKSVN